MRQGLASLRGVGRAAVAAAGFAVLAACATAPLPPAAPPEGTQVPGRSEPLPTRPTARPGVTPPFLAGQAITRVGVLLPFSSRPVDAEAFFNAAELAMFDHGDPAMVLLPRDAGGDQRASETAARALLRDGADIIVGPVLAASVTGAGREARRNRIPVIGFSTDRTVAGDGVYLLSFPLEEEVSRVISFAVSRGVRMIAVLAPDTEYGRRVEQTARAQAAMAGATIVASQFYQRDAQAASAAARAFAPQLMGAGAQGVLIADGGASLSAAATGLLQGGLSPQRVKLLGTGVWESPELAREPNLAGGWYAAPDPTARLDFEARYQSAYGARPPRLASLAYDAVALTALMSRDVGAAGLTRQTLERPQGFIGVDGAFRFRPNGSIERGLAVLEVRPGGPVVFDRAPRRFTAPGS